MIYCANMSCKYCNDKGKCTCPKVKLNYTMLHTKYQGVKELLECKSYEESDLYKKIKKYLKEEK